MLFQVLCYCRGKSNHCHVGKTYCSEERQLRWRNELHKQRCLAKYLKRLRRPFVGIPGSAALLKFFINNAPDGLVLLTTIAGHIFSSLST